MPRQPRKISADVILEEPPVCSDGSHIHASDNWVRASVILQRARARQEARLKQSGVSARKISDAVETVDGRKSLPTAS